MGKIFFCNLAIIFHGKRIANSSDEQIDVRVTLLRFETNKKPFNLAGIDGYFVLRKDGKH
jgi:hypothetical protein